MVTRRSFIGGAAALASSAAIGAPPQFGLAHLTVLGCPPPEMTRIAARAGYEYVGYRTIHMGLANEPNYDLSRNAALLRETKAALADTGVRLHNIELARIAHGVDVKPYAPAIETGAELGARCVIASIWTDDRQAAIDSLAGLCELTAKAGMSVSLEFVSWASIRTLRDVLTVCRAVNRANLGLLIDVLHFNRSRVRPEELDSVPRGWFHFAHVSDAAKEIPSTADGLIHEGREARLYPGEGAIDIASIVNRMPAIPYFLEIPNIGRVRELGYAEHARRCLAYARKYFETRLRA